MTTPMASYSVLRVSSLDGRLANGFITAVVGLLQNDSAANEENDDDGTFTAVGAV